MSPDYSDAFGEHCSDYIQKNESKFITLKKCLVYVGSWNVNAKVAEADNLKHWLNIDGFIGSSPDIVVIGLQEVIELSATNVVGSSVVEISGEKISKWLEQITLCLRLGTMESSEYVGETSNYKLLESVNMVGIFTCIFVKQSFAENIQNVQTGIVARGVGGMPYVIYVLILSY
jgi:hypothetical protein